MQSIQDMHELAETQRKCREAMEKKRSGKTPLQIQKPSKKERLFGVGQDM